MNKHKRLEIRLSDFEKDDYEKRAQDKNVTVSQLIRGAMACKSFEGCKAPLCPLDDSFKSAVWYPGEDICPALKYRREHWRIIQRKIAKVNLSRKVDGCFTVTMLENIQRVSKGISGINPETSIPLATGKAK